MSYNPIEFNKDKKQQEDSYKRMLNIIALIKGGNFDEINKLFSIKISSINELKSFNSLENVTLNDYVAINMGLKKIRKNH